MILFPSNKVDPFSKSTASENIKEVSMDPTGFGRRVPNLLRKIFLLLVFRFLTFRIDCGQHEKLAFGLQITMVS
ncbi:hypothetical protein CEXT_601331 [Caerostris extrusa]|uniref:Uncharacterized protein n=1 Tax=Caerostris extrusa TaxID=172846 RepID=A0AAV4MXL1_CAEEX|nr:hypothetical protein CEXT_601331 [Caerostris extrusa]